jgi:hypothetical protein
MLTDTSADGTTAAADPALAAALVQLLDASLARQGALMGLKDVASGRYLQVNAAMAAFLQRPPSSIAGSTDGELFDAEQRGGAAGRRADGAVARGEPAGERSPASSWAGRRREYPRAAGRGR